MDDKCVICQKSLKNSKKSLVGTSALKTLVDISKTNGDDHHKIFSSVESIELHLSCRNWYTLQNEAIKENNVIRVKNYNQDMEEDREVIEEIKKDREVIQEMEGDREVIHEMEEDREVIEEIKKDREVNEVRDDIHLENENRDSIQAMEIVEENVIINESRNTSLQRAFEQTCLVMEQSHECQFEIQELIEKMKSFLPASIEPYSTKYFVQKISQKFGDTIIVSKAKGVDHVICFKERLDPTLSSVIRMLKSEEDILTAAIEIIKKDVRNHAIRTDVYPSFHDISTGGANTLSPKLRFSMNLLLLPKNPLPSHYKKSLAIQNAMMSLMRPRFVSPLLIGIGTLIHRRTTSKYLIDILNAAGFCSSYSEILKMQKCAATEPQRKKLENAYIQHMWDNADINIRTLNGHGTWHSMGGLECVTPGNCAIVTDNLVRTRSDLSANEVGQFGILPIKSYMKPKVSGLKHMTIKSVELTENDNTIRYYASTECLWLCGRLFDFYFQPSWFGYNTHITKDISGFAQTKTMPLPFINLDPGNLSTIYTALCFTAWQCRQLNQSIIFVTFDQPLYIKAVTIVKSANSSSEISKLVVRLGGFHLLMSFLGTIGYIMNGSGIEELYAQVYAKNTIVHLLSGHAYSRAVRACILTQQALSHLVLEKELKFSERDKAYLQSIYETYDVSLDKELNEPLLKEIECTLNTQFETLRAKSRTSALWIQYWIMVQIVKDYIKAERSGDFNMHLLCVKKMIIFFHAAGRLQYAKCAQIYLQDMLTLKDVMDPKEFKKFVDESFFTIRRTGNYFTGTWTDMVIEQDVMRALKVSGGLNQGRGTSDNCLAVWMGALPYCLEVMNSVEKFCGKFYTTSEQHVELRTSREKIDREDFNKFKKWLIEHNPFDETKHELYSLSTGVVAAPVVNCDRSGEIGANILEKIIGQNFEDVELTLKEKVKPLGFTMKAVKVNGEDIIINPHQLFHRMLTIMPTEEKLTDSFNYELASYPLSIFDENGLRKHETASLFNYLDKVQGSCNTEFIIENSIFIVSGEWLLTKVFWNSTQTFGDVINEYAKYILHYYGRANVIIVFDGPRDKLSQSKLVASRVVHLEPHFKVTVKQSEFLSNDTNKLRLVDFMIKRLNDENIRVYQAENSSDRLIANIAVSTAEKYCENVIVVSEELDILILLIDQGTSENLFMLRPGKNKDRVSDIGSIQEKLGNFKEIILTVHSFSGTKNTSSFYKKGKLTFFNKVMKNESISDQLQIFNVPNAEVNSLYDVGEELLLSIYGATKSTTSINSFRYELFKKINRKKKLNQTFNLAALPPTISAVQQHVMRTYYQVQQWKYNILNPTDWGWISQEGKLNPVQISSTKVVPDWLMETIFCKCKTGCKSNCSCKKLGMACSEACGFCHSECSNFISSDVNIDD